MYFNKFLYAMPAAAVVLYVIRKWRERSWSVCKNRESLDNKVAVVTGANSGIGFQITKELASRNATVIMACRDLALARKAIKDIEKQTQKPLKLVAMELDLASLESIKKFADEVTAQFPTINFLVNNAGVSYPKDKIYFTADEFEIHFGVNHLGHFYLTNLLIDTLKASAPSRIIVLSSTLHERGTINLDNLYSYKSEGWNPYADSKLANIYFTEQLAEMLADTDVRVYAVCPGWVYSNLFRHHLTWWKVILAAPIAFLFMRSSRQGAQTVIYCLTEKGLKNGGIYRDCKRYRSSYNFTKAESKKLWEASENMITAKLNKN